jgi:phospholipid/cholesterol/gamma-HCH transport system permease protein
VDLTKKLNSKLSEKTYKRFKAVIGFGGYASLIYAMITATLRRPPSFRLILKQLYDIGVASTPVVAITGLSTGMVLAAQSFYQLEDKGLASITGLMVTKAMMTELGPVLTAFMVTGRVGAAMCAELGTMKVTEQIDALQTMAVNPNRYLVAPRFLAGVVMLPLLTVFSIIMGIFGGYMVAVYFFDMPPSSYFEPIPNNVQFFDFFTGIAKALFFGLVILTVACYKGMTTEGGAEGVGRSTTTSVVISCITILFSNFFLTVGLNSIHIFITRLIS